MDPVCTSVNAAFSSWLSLPTGHHAFTVVVQARRDLVWLPSKDTQHKAITSNAELTDDLRCSRCYIKVWLVHQTLTSCLELQAPRGVPLFSREPARIAEQTDVRYVMSKLARCATQTRNPMQLCCQQMSPLHIHPMLLSWHGRVCPEPAAPTWPAVLPRAGLPVLRIPSAHSTRRSERCQCGLYVRVSRLWREPVIGRECRGWLCVGVPRPRQRRLRRKPIVWYKCGRWNRGHGGCGRRIERRSRRWDCPEGHLVDKKLHVPAAVARHALRQHMRNRCNAKCRQCPTPLAEAVLVKHCSLTH